MKQVNIHLCGYRKGYTPIEGVEAKFAECERCGVELVYGNEPPEASIKLCIGCAMAITQQQNCQNVDIRPANPEQADRVLGKENVAKAMRISEELFKPRRKH